MNYDSKNLIAYYFDVLIRPILFCCVLYLTPLSYAAAQPTSNNAEAIADPKAKSLLDKVKKQYAGYKTLESSITLTLKLPEQPKEEIQKGKVYQEGDKYRAEVGNQLFISDGKTIWQKENTVVRILNASGKRSGGEILSPKDLIAMYEKNEYSYAITGELADSWSKKATLVTFKPNSRRSEYTQIKVIIDQKTNHVVSITAFGRDQSRFVLSMDAPVVNKKYPADYFTFDKSKFPNVKIEDLRTD